MNKTVTSDCTILDKSSWKETLGIHTNRQDDNIKKTVD